MEVMGNAKHVTSSSARNHRSSRRYSKADEVAATKLAVDSEVAIARSRTACAF